MKTCVLPFSRPKRLGVQDAVAVAPGRGVRTEHSSSGRSRPRASRTTALRAVRGRAPPARAFAPAKASPTSSRQFGHRAQRSLRLGDPQPTIGRYLRGLPLLFAVPRARGPRCSRPAAGVARRPHPGRCMRGACPASRCVQSSSWGLDGSLERVAVHASRTPTIEALPPNGDSAAGDRRDRASPVREARSCLAAPDPARWMSSPASRACRPGTALYQEFARSRRIEVFIWAFFRPEAHPTRAQLGAGRTPSFGRYESDDDRDGFRRPPTRPRR